MVAREPEHVVRVELAWQPAFNVAKQRQHGQGGRGSDDGGKPKQIALHLRDFRSPAIFEFFNTIL